MDQIAASGGIGVHGKAIRMKAKAIAGDFCGEAATGLKASAGWSSRFLKRKKLVCRQVTSVGQEIPPNALTVAKTFTANAQQ